MTATVTEDVQKQVLGAVRKSQELAVGAIKQAVATVSAAVEKMPALPFADRLPSLRELPGVHALPEPEAVVSSAFDFLDRLLTEQRKFAGELIKATAALRPAAPAPAPAPAAGQAGEAGQAE